MLQSFCKSRYTRYWIVLSTRGLEEEDEQDDVEEENEDFLTMIHACEKEFVKADLKRREVIEVPGGINNESSWVKFMKWTDHLQGKDKSLLYQAGQAPKPESVEKRWQREEEIKENQRLRQLADSFERELTRSMKRLHRVPEDTLKWLSSIDPSKSSSKPFRQMQEITSLDRYISYWQRYLCYCARIWALGRMVSVSQMTSGLHWER